MGRSDPALQHGGQEDASAESWGAEEPPGLRPHLQPYQACEAWLAAGVNWSFAHPAQGPRLSEGHEMGL